MAENVKGFGGKLLDDTDEIVGKIGSEATIGGARGVEGVVDVAHC